MSQLDVWLAGDNGVALAGPRGASNQERSRTNSDEREREIQGGVYRRVHALLVGSLVVAAGLLVFNPAIGGMIAHTLSYRGVEPLNVVIPAFLVLYMLPSVAYAWMLPHREDDTPDVGLRVALETGGEAG